MRPQTVRAAELDRFVETGDAARHREEVRQYVQSMFDAGCMRPEWCFVIEEGGRNVGRVALWTLPDMDEPLDLVLLDVPWEDLSAGVCLVADVLERTRSEREIGTSGMTSDPPRRHANSSSWSASWSMNRPGAGLPTRRTVDSPAW
jgi:hypothetical protein